MLLKQKNTQNFNDLDDRYKIEKLIEKMEDTENKVWLQIKDEVLIIKNKRSSFYQYPTELRNLARYCYQEIFNSLSEGIVIEVMKKIEKFKNQ